MFHPERDWDRVSSDLDEHGGAVLRGVLDSKQCEDYRDLFDHHPERFRKSVKMERYRFGRGEYRYLARPYAPELERWREELYQRLRPVALRWWEQLGREGPWPESLSEWTQQCVSAGQQESSTIVLKYRAGDWNALHRDLFGDFFFPLQMVVNLSRPGRDYEGGEFMLVEQRPRAQSRGTVFSLSQGDACIFTTQERPVESKRGWSAAPVRHGVSTVTQGERYALGIVLHEGS